MNFERGECMCENRLQMMLLDTSILLEVDSDTIEQLTQIASVVVTDIVLQEIDGHKNNVNGTVAYRAREFFRQLGKTNGEVLEGLPHTAEKLKHTDTLRLMTLGSSPLFIMVRKRYHSRDINDSKIIEIAKEYAMTLVTADMAQRVRGLSEGLNVLCLEALLPKPAISLKEETVLQESSEKSTLLGTLIKLSVLFLVFASLLSVTSVESVGFVVVLGLLSMVALFGKPIHPMSLAKRDRCAKEATFPKTQTAWNVDPKYSGFSGNIHHIDG